MNSSNLLYFSNFDVFLVYKLLKMNKLFFYHFVPFHLRETIPVLHVNLKVADRRKTAFVVLGSHNICKLYIILLKSFFFSKRKLSLLQKKNFFVKIIRLTKKRLKYFTCDNGSSFFFLQPKSFIN